MKTRADAAAEVLAFLRGLPLFSNLNDSSLNLLAGASRFRRVARGEFLFFAADPGDAAYIVRSGVVSIMLNSADGREMVIDDMHPGDLLGELEVLIRRGHSANAVARLNSEVLVVPPETFLCVLDEDPLLARRLLELTAHRLLRSAHREAALAFMNAQSRLARVLLVLEEQEREIGYVTISQEELAQSAGLIRQTVAKALGEWRRNGWLLTGRGRIVVLNRKALERVEMGFVNGSLVSPK